MNFLTDINLSVHFETATTRIQRWCKATRTDPDSVAAQSAANVAIELMSSNATLAPQELLELLLLRLSGAKYRGTKSHGRGFKSGSPGEDFFPHAEPLPNCAVHQMESETLCRHLDGTP